MKINSSAFTHPARFCRPILAASAASLVAAIFAAPQVQAQILIGAPSVYSQNFDSLVAGTWVDNSTLAGWYAVSTSTFPATGLLSPLPLGTYTTGNARANGFFSAGTGSDRALAWAATTTNYGASAMGVVFQNNSGNTLAIGDISFNGELYVGQQNANALDGLQFFYQIGNTAVTNLAGTAVHNNGAAYAANAALEDTGWTRISGLEYFDSVATASQIQNPAKIKPVLANAGLTLLPGQFITLRWRSFNETGTDGLVGIDDLSVNFLSAPNNLIYNRIHGVGGAPDGIVQVGVGNYWLRSGTPVALTANDNVFFSQPGNATLTVPANVALNTINVTAASGTYTFNGAGGMSGALIKSGAGNVAFSNPNTFSSLTISAGGTLQATGPQTITGPITVPFDGSGLTPTIQTDADVTAASLGGTELLTKTGAAALVLTGSSSGTGTGGVLVSQGRLRTATAAALGPQNITMNGATAALAFTHATGDQTLLANTTITPGAAGAEINVESATLGAGVVIGTANRLLGGNTITKTGPGILRMAANQSFTGNWIINGGAVQYGTGLATAMGTGSVTINAGGELVGQDTVVPVANIILAGGALGTRTNVNTNFTGTVNVTANSEARLRSVSTPTGTQPFTIGGTLTGGGDLSLTGNLPLTDSGGTAQLRLTNPGNTFSGTFRVTQFQTLTSEAAAGTGSALNTRPVILSGGRLRVLDNGTADNGTVAYGNAVTVDSGVATVDVNRQTAGTFSNNAIQLGTLTVAAGATLGSTGANGYQVHFLGATNVTGAGSVTFNPTTAPLVLAGGLGAGGYGVIKNGTGVLAIAGNATYTGNTVINDGTLGTNGQLTGTPRIEIKTGATLDVTNVGGGFNIGAGQTLAGTGSVNGSVLVANGGTIEGGDPSGVGTLTTGPLTLGATAGDTATIRASAGNAGGSLLVGGTNALVTNGGPLSVTVNVFGAQPTVGNHVLIDYDGVIGGTGYPAFKLGSLPPRTNATLFNVANDYIGLNVSSIDFPIWSGAAGSAWTLTPVTPPKNWVLNSNNSNTTDFLVADKTVFNDFATNTLVEVNTVNVAPQEVIFENTLRAYTLQGNAGIEGTTGLVKNGGNLLTILNNNSFTGPVVMNAGTVRVVTVADSGLASPLGAGTTLVFDGGTLEFTGAAGATNRAITTQTNGGTINTGTLSTLTASGVIAGPGGLTKSGNGTLSLTAANTYGGVTTLAGGLLHVGIAEVAGTSGPLGASFAANPGSIVFAGGTLQHSTVNTNDYSGRFSTAPNQAFSVDTNGQTVTWATDLASAGGTLTKSGLGTLTLGGPSSNAFGDTTVTGGTLIAGKAAGVIAIPGNLIIGTGATFTYLTNNVSDQIADTSSVIIDGGTFGDPANAAPTNPGATDKIQNLTVVNGGRFASGRNIPILATPTFEITDTLTVSGGFALAQRGGGITAQTVIVAGPGVINLDGGSTTVGQQSHLRVGGGGLTLVNGTVNLNAGPSAITGTSVGSVVTLNGNVASVGTSALVRQNPTLSVATVDLALGVRTFDVTGTLTIAPDMGAAADLGSGGVVKTGPGKLVLEGVQTYASLTNDAGRTDVLKTIGTGASAVTANGGTINFGESQNLSSLTISDNALVTLGSPILAAPALALASGDAGALAVPEPTSATLLLGGIAALLGLRRRSARGDSADDLR